MYRIAEVINNRIGVESEPEFSDFRRSRSGFGVAIFRKDGAGAGVQFIRSSSGVGVQI